MTYLPFFLTCLLSAGAGAAFGMQSYGACLLLSVSVVLYAVVCLEQEELQ